MGRGGRGSRGGRGGSLTIVIGPYYITYLRECESTCNINIYICIYLYLFLVYIVSMTQELL